MAVGRSMLRLVRVGGLVLQMPRARVDLIHHSPQGPAHFLTVHYICRCDVVIHAKAVATVKDLEDERRMETKVVHLASSMRPLLNSNSSILAERARVQRLVLKISQGRAHGKVQKVPHVIKVGEC